MNRIKELSELKKLKNELEKDMSLYSKDMPTLLYSLYKQTPTKITGFNLPDTHFRQQEYKDYFLRILKRLNNNLLTKEFIVGTKENTLVYDHPIEYSPISILDYSSKIGQTITNRLYPKNSFIQTYIPKIDKYIFELIMAWYYSSNDHDLYKEMLYKRFSNISKSIWDIHTLDIASNHKLFTQYDKDNKTLLDQGYNNPIIDINDLERRYGDINLQDINSYIVANILASKYIRDPFFFNKKWEEIHKTDNTNYEQVLNDLGINYIQHNDIIKSLRMNPGDRYGK